MCVYMAVSPGGGYLGLDYISSLLVAFQIYNSPVVSPQSEWGRLTGPAWSGYGEDQLLVITGDKTQDNIHSLMACRVSGSSEVLNDDSCFILVHENKAFSGQ